MNGMTEEQLTRKIVMFRTELERQQEHSGENLGIKALFDTMCSYFGEQHREIGSLQQQVKADHLRISELEDEIEGYEKENEIYKQQAQKMKEVLQFYGDWENYVWYETNDDPFDFPHQKVDDDKGAKARSILAEMEEST